MSHRIPLFAFLTVLIFASSHILPAQDMPTPRKNKESARNESAKTAPIGQPADAVPSFGSTPGELTGGASETLIAGRSPSTLLETQSELVGEITSMRKVALATKVAGRLEKVPLFAGDSASAGSPIAMLERIDFELAVEQSEAALEVMRAKLRQLEVGSRPEEKKQADEQLRQTKANMENAKADFQRIKDLFSTGAVSKQALDAAEARATVNEAQYMAALQQKAIVDQGPRIEDKQAMRAQIRQQEATLRLSKLQLEYATLKAPFEGVVAMRHSDEGAYVNSQTPIYTFIQVDPVLAAVDCPERLVPGLRAGLKALISIDALPGKIFTGTLQRVPASIDSKTRTARAEFVVENPEHFLKPGMFARAAIGFSPEKGL